LHPLSGHVGSYAEKVNAARAAERVQGVQALAIELDVRLPSSCHRNDVDIARSAENVLDWTTYLPKDSLKVRVEKGWITLSGELDWDFQRQAATQAVHSLLGVTGVSDQIVLNPKVSMQAVKTDIEEALKRRTHADAQLINVHVQGNDVTLSGPVHSWAERSLARNSAWSTPGVHQVVDNMVVLNP
jgi:osmotically-inducible protein OsmY